METISDFFSKPSSIALIFAVLIVIVLVIGYMNSEIRFPEWGQSSELDNMDYADDDESVQNELEELRNRLY